MTHQPELRLGRRRVTVLLCTPDSLKSKLAGHIQHLVEPITGAISAGHFLVQLDEPAVERLYVDLPAASTAKWPLILQLLTSSPSLCSVYGNDEPVAALKALKGAAHPADARPGTIRASFWCDNPVCNLVHTSDTAEDAARELEVLARRSLPCSPGIIRSLTERPMEPWTTVAHSGVVTLYRHLRQHLMKDRSRTNPHLELPQSGSATETFAKTYEALQVLAGSSSEAGAVLDAYMAGEPAEAVALLGQIGPTRPWDMFVVTCGAATLSRWLRRPLEEAITALSRRLTSIGEREWVVSGSAAMALYGIDIRPEDVDVRCTQAALRRLSQTLGEPLRSEACGSGRADVLTTQVLGWVVEFVGDLRIAGRRAAVDHVMLNRRDPRRGLQSAEDLIVEYAFMNRGEKRDADKIRQIISKRGDSLDWEYVEYRCHTWRIASETVREV